MTCKELVPYYTKRLNKSKREIEVINKLIITKGDKETFRTLKERRDDLIDNVKLWEDAILNALL